MKVVDALDRRIRTHQESFYVTVEGDVSRGTFASDNWQQLRVFAALQNSAAFVIRRFEPVTRLRTMKAGKEIPIPLKSICGLFANTEGAVALCTADKMRRAMHTDNVTGEPLPPLDDFVRYVDARVVLPELPGRIMGEA